MAGTIRLTLNTAEGGERFSPLHFMTSLMPTVYEGKLCLFASCSKAITFMRGLNTRKLDFAGLKRPNHVI